MFPSALASASRPRKRLAALVFAAILVVALILAATTSGIGKPGLPSGEVAHVDDVDDGGITQEDLDAAIAQAAAQGGMKKVPAEDDPQYDSLVDQAMQSLILAVWVRGEAAERGLTASETDIEAELKRIKEQSFKNEKEFRQFVKRSKFTPEDVQEQVELTLLRNKLEQDVVGDGAVSDDQVEDFYESNKEQFKQPSSRDARVILNSSKAKAEAAKKALGDDPSEDDWKKVAKKYSEDQASKDRGGLLESLVQGQGDPQLDQQVFAAPENELVGPFKTDRGFYVIEVVDVTPESTQPLDEASDAIRQQLASMNQQQLAADFQTDFVDKWTARTICAPEATIQLCRNFEPPSAEPVEGQPQPSAVPSTQPIEPGASALSMTGGPQRGLPQGPNPGPAAQSATQLPPGAQPVGPPPGAGGAAPPPTP